jgi:alpha-L-arabinofuranosidase
MTKRNVKLEEVPKDPNQRIIMRLYPHRVNLRRSLAPTYYPVEHHIYYDGSSFRVRVRVDGKTVSLNTPDKVKAVKYRNRLLKKAGRL